MKLTARNVVLNQSFDNKTEAIDFVGNKLYECGFVGQEYIAGMHKREEQVSVYMGNGLAIPHGRDDYRQYIQETGIVIVQVPNGVDFDGNRATLLIGLAALGDEHMEVLSNIAILCSEQSVVDELVASDDINQIISLIEEGA